MTLFSKHPRRPISDFEGKRYHHLKFNWRLHSDDFGFIEATVIQKILSKKETKELMAQYAWALVTGYEKELLDAAFGKGEEYTSGNHI